MFSWPMVRSCVCVCAQDNSKIWGRTWILKNFRTYSLWEWNKDIGFTNPLSTERQEHRSRGLGVLTPLEICRGVRIHFYLPKNVTLFHSKLLLDNSASFSSWRMKDLWQKWKVKLIFRGGGNRLMARPEWPWLPYFTTNLLHCGKSSVEFLTPRFRVGSRIRGPSWKKV